jgi:phosphoglycerate dehydrogenase-like enzyme
MIGAEQFGLMKPNAIFINTAHGFCVDEAALTEALQRDRIAGAAIDAFEYEPLAANSPLRTLGDKVRDRLHQDLPRRGLRSGGRFD